MLTCQGFVTAVYVVSFLPPRSQTRSNLTPGCRPRCLLLRRSVRRFTSARNCWGPPQENLLRYRNSRLVGEFPLLLFSMSRSKHTLQVGCILYSHVRPELDSFLASSFADWLCANSSLRNTSSFGSFAAAVTSETTLSFITFSGRTSSCLSSSGAYADSRSLRQRLGRILRRLLLRDRIGSPLFQWTHRCVKGLIPSVAPR